MYDRDNPDWVPNLSLGYASSVSSSEAAALRYHRLHARLARGKSPPCSVDQSSATIDQYGQSSSSSLIDKQKELDKSIQTESIAAVDCACQTNIPNVCNSSSTMLKEIHHLQQCISVAKDDYGKKVLTEEALKNDKNLLKFYTGKQLNFICKVSVLSF